MGFGSVFSRGVRSFAKGPLAQGSKMGLGLGRSALHGMVSFASPGSYVKYAKSVSSSLRSRDLATAAKASANLLGKASGIAMTGRILKGRSPFKDKHGKFDVPFMPF